MVEYPIGFNVYYLQNVWAVLDVSCGPQCILKPGQWTSQHDQEIVRKEYEVVPGLNLYTFVVVLFFKYFFFIF